MEDFAAPTKNAKPRSGRESYSVRPRGCREVWVRRTECILNYEFSLDMYRVPWTQLVYNSFNQCYVPRMIIRLMTHAYPEYDSSRIWPSRIWLIPNMTHPEYDSSRIWLIPNMTHPEYDSSRIWLIPNMTHPEYDSSRIGLIPNMTHPEYDSSRIGLIPNMTHP